MPRMAEQWHPIRMMVIPVLTTCCLVLLQSPSASPVPAALPPASTLCVPRERDALLAFKATLTDPQNWLASWQGEECCRWMGIRCSNRTDHVVELHLYGVGLLRGEMSSSLLDLHHLRSLDLDENDFGGAPIPKFIGALKSLRYLYLSSSNFGGPIPPHLGNLSNLLELRLSAGGNPSLHSSDLAWLKHLQNLQYLYLDVNLSTVTDWAHAINMLPYLLSLGLGDCGFQATNPPPLHTNLTSLEEVELSGNSFNSPLGSQYFLWAFYLPRLQTLYLSLQGPLLEMVVGNLTSLRELHLDDNNLTTSVLTTLRNLHNLEILDLSANNISSPLPEVFGNMTTLRYIDFRSNHITSIPTALKSLHKLERLDLSYNSISGPLPEVFGNMTALRDIDFRNNHITRMPATFKSLNKLGSLDLSNNHINMDIAEILERLPGDRLEQLSLGNNSLTGSLPAKLEHLSNLTTIDLSHNKLTGVIPLWIGALSQLRELFLGDNNLDGIITELHFEKLGKLVRLDLSYNSLTMVIDKRWVPPFGLYRATLRSCKLGPEFPEWLKSQDSIERLDISNTSIAGVIPHWFWTTFAQADYLSLSKNQISGTLTATMFGNMPVLPTNLIFLDFSSNQLEGQIPVLPTTLAFLDLSGNSLIGPLPSHFGTPLLQALILFNNSLSGSIPFSLCQLSNLQYLDLSENMLHGTFPNCSEGDSHSSANSVLHIIMLKLNGNKLSGAFPPILQSCQDMTVLDLSYNEFSGILPTWIGEKLLSLEFLMLRSNMFFGQIPRQLTKMTKLQYLDLACNNISGTIPQSLVNLIAMSLIPKGSNDPFDHLWEVLIRGLVEYNFDDGLLVITKGQQLKFTRGIIYMVNIDLSFNNLRGQIPKELGRLAALKALNLSWNRLSEVIPDSIGGLQALESFDLSHNELSGEIPASLSALEALSHLNLSYNNLTGQIPSGNQLRTLFDQASIYIGNPGLCGPPLSESCSENKLFPASHEKHEHDDVGLFFFLGMGMGCVMGLWLVFCAFLFCRKWRFVCFSFADGLYDWVYAQVIWTWASKRRIRRAGRS